jgi:hypothetical protein
METETKSQDEIANQSMVNSSQINNEEGEDGMGLGRG